MTKPKKQTVFKELILPEIPEPPSREEWDKRMKAAHSSLMKYALKERKKREQKAKPVYAWSITNKKNEIQAWCTYAMKRYAQPYVQPGGRCVKVKIEEV